MLAHVRNHLVPQTRQFGHHLLASASHLSAQLAALCATRRLRRFALVLLGECAVVLSAAASVFIGRTFTFNFVSSTSHDVWARQGPSHLAAKRLLFQDKRVGCGSGPAIAPVSSVWTMKRFIRVVVWFLPAALVTWPGCARYHPKPIVPTQVESDFKGRTLSDPGLRSYVEASLRVKPREWPPRALDLGTLTLAAFYYHPDLDIARARVGVVEAGVKTAASRPNPIVGMGPGYEDLLASPFLFRFTFDLPIETAGKRGYRIAKAQRLTDAARLALAETAWQVRSRLRAALLGYLLSGRELNLLKDEETRQSDAVNLVQKRLLVGQSSRSAVDLVRLNLSETVLAIRSAESRVARDRVILAGALGLPISALDGFTFVWPGLESPPGEEVISRGGLQRAGLLNRLDVRRSLAEYAAADAAVQLEVAKQYPNLHLGPGYAFDDGSNKFTFVPAITLPVFNRNQGPIAQAEARRKEAATRFLALQARVINDTDKALAEYHAALKEVSDADATLAIQEARANATRQALDAGELDRLTLVDARLQALAAQGLRLHALGKAQQALGELEDAVQRPLAQEASLPDVPAAAPRAMSSARR